MDFTSLPYIEAINSIYSVYIFYVFILKLKYTCTLLANTLGQTF